MNTQRFQNRTLRNAAVMLGIALGIILSASSTQADNRNSNPGIHPIGSKPYGLSYGEWSAKWWQWILSIPAASNPNLDNTGTHCAEGQSGHVWFLAGAFGGTFIRTCTIRTGVSILLPILTTAFGAGLADCLSPGWGNAGPCDVPTLRASAAAEEDNPQTLELSVDGVLLQNLSAYRVQSPVFSYTAPSANVMGVLFKFPVPAGTYHPAVADGYWLMLTPLSPGLHVIRAIGVESNGFKVDVTYHLIVEHGG
jgi:hypothetical protein